MKVKELVAALEEPFDASQIEWRSRSGLGKLGCELHASEVSRR